MIQRIQTVWLLLTAVFSALFFIFQGIVIQPCSIPVCVLNIAIGLSGVLALITIFLYKNRKLQVRLCTGIILLQVIGYIALFAFFGRMFRNGLQVESMAVNLLPLSFPLFAIICTLLARRAIKRDEKLVRSLDRLR